MKHQEWVLGQFNVCTIKEGRFHGWICFRTPLADYRISKEDWECIKEKINKV